MTPSQLKKLASLAQIGKKATTGLSAVKEAEIIANMQRAGEAPLKMPSVIIPSKISNVEQAIRHSKGEYGAKRVQRAADQVKNLENQYTEEALRLAFGGDNAAAMMVANPAEFQKYAAKLSDPYRAAIESYMQKMSPDGGGASAVPFLQFNKNEGKLPFITGHEGRHRNVALEELGDESTLWRMLPSASLRERSPRRTQEEYLQALIEQIGDEPLVIPEERFTNKEDRIPDWTKARKLPPLFAEGGSVEGGAVNMPNFFNTDVNFGNQAANSPPPVSEDMLQQIAKTVGKAKGGAVTNAWHDLIGYKDGGASQKMAAGGIASQEFPLKDEPKKPLTSLEQDVYNTFGMLPDEDRLSILPRYKKDKGLIAPEMVYDLVKAIQSPRTSMRAELGPDDALNFALNTMGGSSVASAPQGVLQMGIAKTPRMSRAEAEAAGFYHPYNDKLKLRRPYNDMTSTVIDNPNVVMPSHTYITPEDIVGGAGVPLIGDRADTGKIVTHVNNIKLERPVNLTGGGKYMMANQHPTDPEKSSAWESGKGVVKALHNRIEDAYKYAPDVYGIYVPGSHTSVDFNRMLSNTLLGQMHAMDIAPESIALFDREMKKLAKKIPYAGLNDREALYEQINKKENGVLRKKFVKLMNSAKFQEMGFPDVAASRKAISDADLHDVALGDSGSMIARMAGDRKIIENPLNPSDYPVSMGGDFMGGFKVPLPRQNIWTNHAKLRRELGTKSAGDQRSLEFVKPVQYFDQEWLDQVMPIYEQRIKKLIGKKNGGLAVGGVPEKRDVSQLFPLKWSADANLNKGRTGVWTDTNDVFTGAMSGLFNTLAGGLRGRVIGAAGVPGDIIEGMSDLEGALPTMERKPKGQTFPQTYKAPPAFKLPTMEELDTMLPSAGDSHEAKIAQELGQFMPITGNELAPAGRAIVSSAKKLAPTAAEMAVELASKYGVDPRMNIIKPKGGNWMPDTPERMTERLKTPLFVNKTPEERVLQHEELLANPALTQEQKDRIQMFLDQTKGQVAADKWVDQKLNKYIKSEMGTESDPIRLGIERRYEQAKELRSANQKKLDKMADDIDKAQAKGKTTTISERDLAAARQKFAEEEDMAFNGLYHGTIPEGGWANYEAWYEAPVKGKRKSFGMPEEGLGTHPASRHWESTVDDEIGKYSSDGFKAPHMQNSGLIKNNPWLLNLPPDTTLYKLDTIDGNLEFRHMIDELKNSLDPLSNLPKHLKIAPKDLEKMTVDDVSALSGKINAWRNVQKTKTNLEIANNPATHTFKEYPLDESNPKGVSWRQIKKPEGYSEEEAEKFVRDATKYEGDIMRHCVGGSSHCEPLISGKTELYTLRDAKGEPHVTIEVGQAQGRTNYEDMQAIYNQVIQEANQNNFATTREWNNFYNERVKKLQFAFIDKQKANLPKRILEIKGKLNRKPKDEYIPFVQDFIKSGNWSDIADIHHTDLRKAEDVLGQNVVKELRSRGEYVPPVLDFDEAAHFHEMFSPGSLDKYLGGKEEYRKTWNKQDYAQGGAVHMADGGAVNAWHQMIGYTSPDIKNSNTVSNTWINLIKGSQNA